MPIFVTGETGKAGRSSMARLANDPRAKRQIFNACMDQTVHAGGEAAGYRHRTRGLNSIDISSRLHSSGMDGSKARYVLDHLHEHHLELLIDSAWRDESSKNDPRVVWNPG